MLTIRLQRVGRKNDPSFRVVVTDSKNGPQSGKFLEVLGSYNARFGKPQLNIDRIQHWLKMGAGISNTVRNMLIHFKVIDGVKTSPLPPKKESPVVETPPAPEEVVATEPQVESTSEEVSVETESSDEPKVEEVVAPEPEVSSEEKTA